MSLDGTLLTVRVVNIQTFQSFFCLSLLTKQYVWPPSTSLRDRGARKKVSARLRSEIYQEHNNIVNKITYDLNSYFNFQFT